MKVTELFSVDDLEAHIAEGLVTRRKHPTLPLFILNYSARAAFERRWNAVTLNCRGLILDDQNNIVSRPWKKFFNLGEGFAEFDWDSPVEVTDKMDGSLGILWVKDFHHGGWIDAEIATRGSFESDQARHATRVWRDRYYNNVNVMAGLTYTFLFEIVYPANRIVLNYGELDDLVLLGAVENEYGYYLGPNEAAGILNWPGPVTEVFEYKTLQDAFSNNDRQNKEGYVVRSGNKMVKLKQADYISLHKLVTGLNDRAVWEQMVAGKGIPEICEPLPDEFHEYVARVATRLQKSFDEFYEACYNEYAETVEKVGLDCSRKDFAAVASKSRRAGYLFKLFDGKRVDDAIWQEIKPEATIDGLSK